MPPPLATAQVGGGAARRHEWSRREHGQQHQRGRTSERVEAAAAAKVAVPVIPVFYFIRALDPLLLLQQRSILLSLPLLFFSFRFVVDLEQPRVRERSGAGAV